MPDAPGSVLFVGAFLPQGTGSRSVSEDVAERLAARGWVVELTSRRRARAARLADLLWTAARRRASYRVAHVDVYSGAAFRWAEVATRWLRVLGKPVVLTLHGGNLPELSRRQPGRVERLLRRAALVTAPSAYLGEYFTTARGDIRILPNALELGRYPFVLQPVRGPRLLWLRAFDRTYDPVLAVEALSLLDLPAASLEMVGPDKGDGALEDVRAAVSRLGLEGRVSIRPGVAKEDVPSVLAGGELFLNSSRIDNTPVTVMEAMACGLPVVSTDVGGVRQLCEHEREALLVPARDASAMAQAILRLCRDPHLAGRLAQAARARVEALDWSRVLPRWHELFASLQGMS